jgi:S-adenosylmethionine:tRNA ribosyltransferase-isomerase
VNRPVAGIDPSLLVDEFDYDLPPDLIAQTPLPRRDASRLLVLDRRSGRIEQAGQVAKPGVLDPGDLLVANNSRVIPARLSARRSETGGRVELLLLRDEGDGEWTALAKPARRLRPGTRLLVEPRPDRSAPPAPLSVVELLGEGEIRLRFDDPAGPRLDDYGASPLPPYVRTAIERPERYQTVYAAGPGSAAAPTAGLHFTDELIADLLARGVGWSEVTLHVGIDTFRPVTAARVADHRIHREWCAVPPATVAAVRETRRAGRRVVAVGTTAARTLETLGGVEAGATDGGVATMTDLFIVPGYRWTTVDALLTNFHLPRSTLLMMVSAFAGRDRIRRAYEAAIEARYRFFSFGDAMLIR